MGVYARDVACLVTANGDTTGFVTVDSQAGLVQGARVALTDSLGLNIQAEISKLGILNRVHLRPIEGQSSLGLNTVLLANTPRLFQQAGVVDDETYTDNSDQPTMVLPWASTITLDLGIQDHQHRTTQLVVLAGNTTFQCINHEQGKETVVYLFNGGGNNTLTFPAAWKWFTNIPASESDAHIGKLVLTCLGGDDSMVMAEYLHSGAAH